MFVRPLVTRGTVGALGLFKLPDRLGVVVCGGLGVVADLPLAFRLRGLRNLKSGFVDLRDDSVVVCKGVVSLSKYSVNGVSSVNNVVVVNSFASFSWSSCLAVGCPLNNVDDGRIPARNLEEALGNAVLEARTATLADDPLIDVGPRLLP